LIPPFIFTTFEIPALVFLGIWFVVQFLNGVGSLDAVTAGQYSGGVAFWAHVAGFAAGVVGIFAFRRPERQRVEWWNDVR
jgi:membrane associated rhomboid family serine protease